MSKKSSSFVGAAAFFAASGIVIKMLGAIYKIYLGNGSFLGVLGVSYIAFIYPYYNALLAIATAGIPSAVAKIVSGLNARDEQQQKENVFRVVRGFMASLGMVMSIGLFLLAPVICEMAGFEGAVHAMRMIAIAVFVIPFMATYRGYFQGHGDLKPYGLSQILEQLCRVGLGILFAYLMFPMGIEYAAAGAVLGTSLGAIASTFFLLIYYKVFAKNRNFPRSTRLGMGERLPIIKEVLYYAIPITIAASIIPIIEIIDGQLIKSTLMGIGYASETAQAMYSYHSFYSESVINFPVILFTAVQVSILPAVAALVALKDNESLGRTIRVALKITVIIGLGASFGLFALAEPVIALLWPDLIDMHAEVAAIVRVMCLSLFFASIYQATSGIMQGMGLHIRNAIHLFVGSIVKLALTYTLLSIPFINIKGAAIATAATFFVAGILNLLHLRRKINFKPNYMSIFIKPISSALVMAVIAYFTHSLLLSMMSNFFATVISVLLGASVYAVLILVLRVLNREDLEFLPLKRVFSRFVKD